MRVKLLKLRFPKVDKRVRGWGSIACHNFGMYAGCSIGILFMQKFTCEALHMFRKRGCERGAWYPMLKKSGLAILSIRKAPPRKHWKTC